MKRVDVQKMLEENGFRFVRQNKHPIFSDGLSNIVFPCSSGEINHGLVHQIRSEIRKAVAKREEIKFVKNFKSSDPAELAEKYLYLAELEKPVPEKEMKVAKFKEKDRRPIDEMIKTLYHDGASYKKIARALGEEGFTTPMGEKINEKFVSNSIYRMGLSRKQPELQPLPPTPPPPPIENAPTAPNCVCSATPIGSYTESANDENRASSAPPQRPRRGAGPSRNDHGDKLARYGR